jgi:hypothetical protein
MLRIAGLMIAALAMCGAGFAQEPQTAPRKARVALELKTGETVLLQDATKVGEDQLCGLVRYKNKSPGPNCIFLGEIESARFADVRSVVFDAVRSGVCMASGGACLAIQ